VSSPSATQTQARAPVQRAARPTLLLLVFGAFLLIVGISASGQAALVTADQQQALLGATVSADASTVRTFVAIDLPPRVLDPAAATAADRATLQAALGLLVQRGQLLQVAVLLPDGTVLASNDGTGVGGRAPLTTDLQLATGQQQAEAAIQAPADAGALGPLDTTAVMREYLPVISGGQVRAVVAVWRDAAPLLAQLDQERLEIVGITLTAALLCAVLLGFIFRTAQRRLTRQAQQLVEAARHDPLTGLLNHGSLVELLGARLEEARKAGRATSVALLDLDNFRLLNDTHGHPAGDQVLHDVTRLLQRHAPATALVGRYGPDEFLVVASPRDTGLLERAMEDVRSALAELAPQFEGSERLPVTVSVGIALYPLNGASVTPLLTAAAEALDEAKAGGGDAVRVAEVYTGEHTQVNTFDVLQGLVIAVDTKDKYTRRHSEDVARYGDFLARELGLDAETRRAVHTAGLLHDVGKIGIPDVILRKPGKLTDEEYAIVKQHVTLGDRIVHGLPDLELVRAGVRHHHERWDGHGYADGLEGADIPFIARLLAVGDAFSAMTTTRPYRKALSIEEALRRLEDAAGTQLDEQLVRTFVNAMRTATDAPLEQPSAAIPMAGRLWVPDSVAARVA
jgi:diguanylate cyclase (GGDEF)-like protein